jgi:putative transcriptional regulator
MLTVIETPVFLRYAAKVWDGAERDEFIVWLAEHPDAGDVMAATGGLRKVRWARPGMGKRGGVRVIYMLRNAQVELVFLTVYVKAEHDTLSNAFLRSLAQLYEEYTMSKISAPVDAEMTDLEKDLLESIRQAKRGEGRVTQVAVTAATEARLKLGVSQSAFAQLLGVSVRTLQEWEQGRREPSGAARTLLRIALKSPEAILQAV